MKITIKELQNKGYKKTSVPGLYLTNAGKAYNYLTKRECKPTTKGQVKLSGKGYNLAKMVLETFKKEPVRTGQILFLNGNDKDFGCNNLSYAVGTHYKAPSEADLIYCIRLYFEVPKKLTRNDILFKDYLKSIAELRGFIYKHKSNEFNLFLDWLKPFTQSQSKAKISIANGYTVRNGENAINKYLGLLVKECLEDQENGILKVKQFKSKPPTKTQKLKDFQKFINENGLDIKIPLRKPSVKETFNKYLKQNEKSKSN